MPAPTAHDVLVAARAALDAVAALERVAAVAIVADHAPEWLDPPGGGL